MFDYTASFCSFITLTRLLSVQRQLMINQSINIRLFDGMIITTDTNATVIYTAGPECSKAEYQERPAANDLTIEHNY